MALAVFLGAAVLLNPLCLALAPLAVVPLVVYPYADHGFNLTGANYRAADDADAWRRTIEMLQRYQPLR